MTLLDEFTVAGGGGGGGGIGLETGALTIVCKGNQLELYDLALSDFTYISHFQIANVPDHSNYCHTRIAHS